MGTQATDLESVPAFRRRASQWARQNLVPLTKFEGLEVDDDAKRVERVAEARDLQRRLFDADLAGIRYPRQYGGQGLTREHQLAWRELTAGCRLPAEFNVTHGVLGPTLLEFGSEEQKLRNLPMMLMGETLWVQFLSEPSSGSDLAGVLTRARREGDSFVMNGSKTWSTGAHFSDYAMVLVRTNGGVPKHSGLSMFMMEINSPGVTIRPIRLVTGGSHFCEEFFEDVSLPASDLIGPEDDGWRVASRLLFHEKNMIGRNGMNDHVIDASDTGVGGDDVVELARQAGRVDDQLIRQLIGESLVLQRVGPHLISRINALIETDQMAASGAGIVKLMRTQSQYRMKEIALEVGGTRSVMSTQGDVFAIASQRWLGARIGTIAGGSSEIQRNVISERVLGLPREPAADRDLPFDEVLASRRR